MTTQTLITEPDAPELFAGAFPPESFPRYDWTERPAGMPAAAWTTETTHRDGQQGGLPLTVEAGVRIYELMCAFTGRSGAIRQAEFFVYRPADRRMLEIALERRASGAPVEPTTWIRASRADAALVGGLGVRETGMLASASDYHTFHKFRPGGRRQAAGVYLDAVRAVLDAGLRPRLHLEDATRAPRTSCCPSPRPSWRSPPRSGRSCARSSGSATRWASACRSRPSRRRAPSRATSGRCARSASRPRTSSSTPTTTRTWWWPTASPRSRPAARW